MSIVQEQCPACAGPLPIQLGARHLKCMYCGSALSVERHGDGLSVELAEQVIGKIEASGAQTQAEFQRLRLLQELSNAEMRLANVQGEVRSIQRSQMNAVARTHLNELHQESLALQKQIAELKHKLDPVAAPAPSEQVGNKKPLSKDRLMELLFSFTGRITRSDFWLGMAITAVIFFLLLLVVPSTPENPDGSAATVDMPPALSCLAFLLLVASMWMGAAVGAKRFHDRDKSGWWVFVGLIPIIGFFWFIIELGLLLGTPGPNKYG